MGGEKFYSRPQENLGHEVVESHQLKFNWLYTLRSSLERRRVEVMALFLLFLLPFITFLLLKIPFPFNGETEHNPEYQNLTWDLNRGLINYQPTLLPKSKTYKIYNLDTERLVFEFSDPFAFKADKVGNIVYFSDNGFNKIYMWDTDMDKINEFADLGSIKNKYQITDEPTLMEIKIFDDYLYLTFGEYMKMGSVVRINLRTASDTEVISNIRNPSVLFYRDKYWIIGGEGDACWSTGVFYLHSIDSGITRKLAEYEYSCGTGQSFIGLDNKNRLLFARHVQVISDNPDEDGVIENIQAVPVDSPETIVDVISKNDIPKGIKYAFLDENGNNIYLEGNKNYSYNLATGSLLESNEAFKEIQRQQFPRNEWYDSQENFRKLNLGNKYLLRID